MTNETILNKLLANPQYNLSDALALMKGFKRVPFGGNDGNIAPINQGVNSIAALVERVTNAEDSITERLILETKSQNRTFNTPFEARDFFVSTNPKMVQEKILVHVMTPHGGRSAEATFSNSVVDVVDRGTGISPEMAQKSILSLHKSTKIDAKHSIGCFGQGGSVTYSFVDPDKGFTLLASRDSKDRIWFTIVFFENPSELTNRKVGMYVYLVDGEGDVPYIKADPIKLVKGEDKITTPATVKTFQQGTLVRHHYYNLGTYCRASRNEFSVYTGLNYFLPAPPYPVHLTIGNEPHRRTIFGLEYMLTKESVYSEKSIPAEPLEIIDPVSGDSLGKINASVHVLKPKEERDPGTGGKTATTIMGDMKQTVILMRNGQTHDHRRISELSQEIRHKFDALNNPKGTDIVVLIRADGLTLQAMAKLFASGREKAKDHPILLAIQRKVAEFILNDPELVALNEIRRKDSMKGVKASKVSVQMLDFVRPFLAGSKRAAGSLVTAGSGKDRTRARAARTFERIIPNPKGPTTLSVHSGDDEIELHPGQERRIILESDAPNGWAKPAVLLDAWEGPQSAIDFEIGEWMDGRLRVRIKCNEHLNVDREINGRIIFRFPKIDAEVLYDIRGEEESAPGDKREKLPKKGSGGTQVYEPNGEVVHIVSGDDRWKQLGLEPNDAEWFAYHVQVRGEGNYMLYIFRDNVHLREALKGLNKVQQAAVRKIYEDSIGASAVAYANRVASSTPSAETDPEQEATIMRQHWSESSIGFAFSARNFLQLPAAA
jgi:hypothetical protein